MDRKKLLLKRLDQIGMCLAKTGQGLALIGLGSVGVELDRMDEYSDLDFFVIVQPGTKSKFLENLRWLDCAATVAYSFRNTSDGYKILFGDGIYAEFAVFEPDELPRIPFSAGRIIWKASAVDDALSLPAISAPHQESHCQEWLLGEALTCLYVGLSRYARGEKLSAQRFIQQYAVDRLLELAQFLEPEKAKEGDPFAPERRVEVRFPLFAQRLPEFVQGYNASPASALALLNFLELNFKVHPVIKNRILEMYQATLGKPAVLIRDMRNGDPEIISTSFESQGWHKPATMFQNYLKQSKSGLRSILVAEVDNQFAGYLTILWESGYPPFSEAKIPEIADFNVLKRMQRRGFGTALMDEAERLIRLRSPSAGIAVGLTAEYGAAQILYARRGYVPDGTGILSAGRPVRQGDQIHIDHSSVLYLIKQLKR